MLLSYMAVHVTFEFRGSGLSSIRALVQRCNGLKRLTFLIGVVTALPHRTSFGLNAMLRLKWLRTTRRTTLSRIVFTNRRRILLR